MARSQESSSKKENEKKKKLKAKEKAEAAAERKANARKGQALEDMMAYIDENGNLSSTPPDPKKMREYSLDDIQLGARKDDTPEDAGPRTGTVTMYNDSKGFGFIKDSSSGESIFVHVSNTTAPLREGMRVSFATEKGDKGPVAVQVTPV